jgi:hypothetical protein
MYDKMTAPAVGLAVGWAEQGPTFALEAADPSLIKEIPMITRLFVAAIALCSNAASARSVFAQAPCAVTSVLADSARDDVSAVLESESKLVQELRHEQGLPASGPITPIDVVSDPLVCSRLKALFDHAIGPRASFVVLRVGPLYYAREPDQRRGTGLIADSTYHVLLRLGASIASEPAPPRRP